MGGLVGSGDGWRGDSGDKVVIASFSEPFHADGGGDVDACCRCLLFGRVEITVCFAKTPPPPIKADQPVSGFLAKLDITSELYEFERVSDTVRVGCMS